LLFARRAAEIPKPADRLLVETLTYAWGIRLELGIAEVRAGDPERGREILDGIRELVPPDYELWIDEVLGIERPIPERSAA
jgi:hypothetical protein